ncbi:MAG: hypothetical protein A2W31_05040 [Planctomycetes bacterium RBG_16_64_10]|nr:MAG: hypothetical protein A2W31_05040 [Planctomycetes bacterium RBG_16_64_10]
MDAPPLNPNESQRSRCARFTVHHRGPELAYTLPNRKAEVVAQIKRVYQPGDKVLLVWGEIDVRCHLVKQAQAQGTSVAIQAAKCVVPYVSALIAVLGAAGLPALWVLGPTPNPPGDIAGVWGSSGTSLQRAEACKEFHILLRAHAAIVGIHVVSAWGALTMQSGECDPTYLLDVCHLNQLGHAHVLKECEAAGLL